MGIGVLSVSRGYGPITQAPFPGPPPVPVTKEGGDGPLLVQVDPVHQPKMIVIQPEAKKKC